VTTYITFGSDHEHPALGSQLHDGFVTIDLPGFPRHVEREVIFAMIGGVFAFDYDEEPGVDRREMGWYRKGEIARVTLINEQLRRDIVKQISHTYDMAEGGSNDDEIEALQTARDMLASLIGHEEER
jgi:hypothetical protein